MALRRPIVVNLILGVCPSGYSPAGNDCNDVDECVSNNGHGPCQDKCSNTDGSFKCSCDVSNKIHTKKLVDYTCDEYIYVNQLKDN
jgi:hypothetical protein